MYDLSRSWVEQPDPDEEEYHNYEEYRWEDYYPMQQEITVTVTAPYIAHATLPQGFTQLVIADEQVGLTLEQCQEAVGGYVQRVFIGDGLILLVNEDGIAQDLPLNVIATALYRTYSLPTTNVNIYGDAIVAREDMFK